MAPSDRGLVPPVRLVEDDTAALQPRSASVGISPRQDFIAFFLAWGKGSIYKLVFVKTRWFVRGDIDGFFGLFIDNLLQLMVITVLGRAVCGFPTDLIHGRILPGAGASILVGNLFYSWQARRLAQRTGRADVTALPYGINTPSVFAYILLIMGPVYQETHDATLA